MYPTGPGVVTLLLQLAIFILPAVRLIYDITYLQVEGKIPSRCPIICSFFCGQGTNKKKTKNHNNKNSQDWDYHLGLTDKPATLKGLPMSCPTGVEKAPKPKNPAMISLERRPFQIYLYV